MHLQDDDAVGKADDILRRAYNAAHPKDIYFNDVKNEGPPAKIREVPKGTRRKVKVIFMGFGFSGLNFQKEARELLEDVDIVFYEKNADLGGTWLENRYPGCACDIPSVVYQFSWHPKPWTHYYSSSPEIYEYMESVAKEYDLLQDNVKFNHKIVEARWMEDIGKWDVTVMRNDDPSDTFHDQAEVFLHGGGVLNHWRWPQINGLRDFKGPLMHSARWDNSINLEGKRILLIGSGSSGVQIVPNIIDKVKSLDLVVRSPVWITAGFAPSYAGEDGANIAYGPETKQRMKDDPEFLLRYMKAIESELNVRFKFAINGSEDAKAAKDVGTERDAFSKC